MNFNLNTIPVAIVCITIMILAFNGEPDLWDAIIKILMEQGNG